MNDTVEFTYLGVISGFCLSICGVTTFAAIKYIGLSIGVTIWSGTAILISFVQGFLAGTKAENLWIAIIGCILLIIGIIGAGFSDKIVKKLCANNVNKQYYNQTSPEHAQLLNDDQKFPQHAITTPNSNSNLGAFNNNSPNDELQHSMMGVAVGNGSGCGQGSITKPKPIDEQVITTEDGKYGDVVLGIIFAIMTGLFGGSIGFPSNW
eukprot:CAMPEP_0201576098 /NCGR_PEP_ID=MMETSP0190_2-20130828/21706_1 /ASSEMBLY_ACC=CAM_ASM_000263 /TAXON_ID=37353 /ORGANISM="Rosalina sp." /LENGTH=207 /DNA_ID=CAMNT_0048006557 /DNA_START=125 /DNA_END=745 /DNA_ORIENTATION=-